jgi:type I restriction enzyme R subunit
MDFLAENKELPVIQKIVNMEKLSFDDICELEKICWKELGTKEDYEKFIAKSNMICGDSVGAFIRSQIGVDRHIAMERFSQFLSICFAVAPMARVTNCICGARTVVAISFLA